MLKMLVYTQSRSVHAVSWKASENDSWEKASVERTSVQSASLESASGEKASVQSTSLASASGEKGSVERASDDKVLVKMISMVMI